MNNLSGKAMLPLISHEEHPMVPSALFVFLFFVVPPLPQQASKQQPSEQAR